MNPLAQILRRRIDAEGPLTVAEYMTAVLRHPEYGYYVRKDPFGTDGDSVTAPEISQMFGELIGLWCAVTWRQLGSPSPVALVELSAGRGTLMAGALRALEMALDFLECADVHFVKASPVLRRRQREALSGHTVTWHYGVEDIPDGAVMLVANEFLDALAIRQLVRRDDAWHERLIAWEDDGFRFLLDPAASPLAVLFPDALSEGDPNGEIAEVSPAVLGLARAISSRIARDGGAALFIDYGHTESALGEPLQAVRDHALAGVLADPGSADLTAHVDFGAFARAAETRRFTDLSCRVRSWSVLALENEAASSWRPLRHTCAKRSRWRTVASRTRLKWGNSSRWLRLPPRTRRRHLDSKRHDVGSDAQDDHPVYSGVMIGNSIGGLNDDG